MEEPQFKNLYLLHSQFAAELKTLVNGFLVHLGRKRYADGTLMAQWLFALTCYLLPLAMMFTMHSVFIWILAICSGAGAALLTFSLAQTGAHAGIYKHKWFNELQLFSAYLIGRPQYYWLIGHAYLHHYYTNVPEFDRDTSCFGLIRSYKGVIYKPWHRFQHYYAWFLYAVQPLLLFFADFYLIFRYARYMISRRNEVGSFALLLDLLLSKIIYLVAFIWLPVSVFHFSIGIMLLALALINITAGILIFPIVAGCHQFEGSEFLVRYHGKLDAEPQVHQLSATRGFSHNNKWLTWLTAGINFHTEHHLFPDLPFVHYPAVSLIIEKEAHDHGFKYHYQSTYRQLLISHYHYLKAMSHRPAVDHRYDEQFRGHYFKRRIV
ncbi:MAG: fatty acid desaturase family protein [Mucilaginibacter sp.]